MTAANGRVGTPRTDGTFPIRYYRVARYKWTFEDNKTRAWVESWLNGRVLNSFAGETFLSYEGDIVRNDANPDRPADHHLDVNKLGNVLDEDSFDTIVHDPPWSERQSMKSYEGVEGFVHLPNDTTEIIVATPDCLKYRHLFPFVTQPGRHDSHRKTERDNEAAGA